MPQLRSPGDIKKLCPREIEALASEIRREIIETVSENGGHLASNLGLVEATLAIHTVFNIDGSENGDSLIFDVGHQAYTHKLITGRYKDFRTLRTEGGISGFTNRSESVYDTVTCGHSGSSISTAVGIAEGNRLRFRAANNEAAAPYAIAVVGDGSFTNGMIYEALNSLAGRGLRLIIILNDNEMSISKNVGGMSRYLSYIRTSERYFSFKLGFKKCFGRLPLIGEPVVRLARGIKNFIKRATNCETFFENLGLEYIGPANGNDFRRTVSVLEEAVTKDCPVVVHIKTKKGMGYPPAEENPQKYHSTSPFDIQTGEIKKKSDAVTFTDIISDYICAKAEADTKLCAITAAMTDGCGLKMFSERYPDRFFDLGIAEEHAAALTGGLAIAGHTPVLFLYSTFSQRVFDQLWQDICLQNIHCVLCLTHCGLVPGDGITHQGIYDISIMKALPNLTVYSPFDGDSLQSCLDLAISGRGLCVVRYPKDRAVPLRLPDCAVLTEVRETGLLCKRITLRADKPDAKRLLVFTYGRIAHDVLTSLEKLLPHGISSELIILEQLLPLPASDIASFADSISPYRTVFIEEGVREGGIGESAAAVLNNCSVISVSDKSIPSASLDSLKKYTSLDPDSLTEQLLNA